MNREVQICIRPKVTSIFKVADPYMFLSYKLCLITKTQVGFKGRETTFALAVCSRTFQNSMEHSI